MRRMTLVSGLAAGALALSTGAQADCSADAQAFQLSVQTGEPLKVGTVATAAPALGGALAPADPNVAVVGVSRIPVDATRPEKVDALEALEQAQIYGAKGLDDACQVALHEAFRHLNVY